MPMRVVAQRFVNVDINDIRPHPQNPNRGDAGLIFSSIEKNGFFGVVGFQRSTGHILFGNHRYEAARQQGATHLPALEIDVDDDEALRILLVDNRAARLGTDDKELLAELLSHLATTDLELEGTGYTSEFLDALNAEIGAVTEPLNDAEQTAVVADSQFILTIHLANEGELESLYTEMQSRGLDCRMLT